MKNVEPADLTGNNNERLMIVTSIRKNVNNLESYDQVETPPAHSDMNLP